MQRDPRPTRPHCRTSLRPPNRRLLRRLLGAVHPAGRSPYMFSADGGFLAGTEEEGGWELGIPEVFGVVLGVVA